MGEQGWSGRRRAGFARHAAAGQGCRGLPPCGSDFPPDLQIQFLQASAGPRRAHVYVLRGAGGEPGHRRVRNHWASEAYFSL